MPYQALTQKIEEINELTLLTEETLAQLQLKMEELKLLCRKHQEVFPNPALLIDPATLKRLKK